MLDAQFLDLPDTQFIKLAPLRGVAGISVYKNRLPALQEALGVSLPGTPRRITADGIDYLWAGEGSWLAMAKDLDIAARIAELADGLAAITDQSDGRVIFRATGPDARDIMARLVPIDLHPDKFPPDATALTLAAHITVQIWQEDDGAYEIACFRSFAGALHHALLEASR